MKRNPPILFLVILLAVSCAPGPSLLDRTGIAHGTGVKTVAISYATDPENALLDFIDGPAERKQLLPNARFLNRREKIAIGTPVIFDRLVPGRGDKEDLINGHLFLDGNRIPVVIRTSALLPLFGLRR